MTEVLIVKNRAGKNIHSKAKKNQSGSITVFLTLILMSVILLTGSMIDISRIMVADNKMDSAIRAATKSLMAEYDTDLYGSYGLFGINLDENEEVFAEYMKQNLDMSSTAFMKYEFIPESASVSGLEDFSLANTECLQDQINSYMALKGPVNWGSRAAIRALNTIKVALDKADDKIKEKSDKDNLDKIDSKEYTIEATTKSDKMADIKDKIITFIGEINDENNRSTALAEDIREALKNEEATGLKNLPDSSEYKGSMLKQIKDKAEILVGYADEMISKKKALEKEKRKSAKKRNQSKIDRLEKELEDLEVKYKSIQAEIVALRDKYNDINEETAEETANMKVIRENLKKINTVIYGLDETQDEMTTVENGVVAVWNQFVIAKNFVNEICSNLIDKKGAELLGDKFNDIEYILDRFSYATSSVERELSVFRTGEVEYIIIGSNTESINLIGTATKIFLICLVADMIDLILMGTPLWPVTFLAGIVYAAGSVDKLLSGEKFVPLKLFLTKRLKMNRDAVEEAIGMTYMDFLYLQLITMDQETLLTRIGKLLRANINKDFYESNGTLNGAPELSQYVTGIKTNAACRVNLLFLPIFPLEAMNLKGFEGNMYTLDKEYKFAYQDIRSEE